MEWTYEEIEERWQEKCWVDLRSPLEYEEDHLPGAVNLPIFNNQEREEIGTLYKQVGERVAKQRGLEILAPKLPSIMDQLREWSSKQPTILYCWRGGMRSTSIYQVAHWMGIPVHRLLGGYRHYRQVVNQFLETWEYEGRFVVLHGHTGVGKTVILQQLATEGYPVLDLEGLANHKGSIFGNLGTKEQQPSQKAFENQLYQALLQLQKQPFIVIEAESKRIGDRFLPDHFMDIRQKGIQIMLDAPIFQRVQQIKQDYIASPYFDQQSSLKALKRIAPRFSGEVYQEIYRSIETKEYNEAIQLLMLHYYDPRYDFGDRLAGLETVYSIQVNEETAEMVPFFTQEVKAILHQHFPHFQPIR